MGTIEEIIIKLEKIFPNKHIAVNADFNLHSFGRPRKVELTWTLYVADEFSLEFPTLKSLITYAEGLNSGQSLDPAIMELIT